MSARDPHVDVAPDARLLREAELVDPTSVTEVATFVAEAMVGGLIGGVTYDLVRAAVQRRGGRILRQLGEQLASLFVERLPEDARDVGQQRVDVLLRQAGSPELVAPPLGLAWDYFLVHPSPLKPLVRQVRDALAPSHTTFLDEVSIPPGSVWAHAIPQALAQTRVFAVFLTTEVDRRWYAREEVTFAIEYVRQATDRRVVPVVLDPMSIVDYPYGLGTVQALQAHHRDPHRIATALRAVLP